MTTLTTDEILKPDIELPAEKCFWHSKRRHCWHQIDEKNCSEPAGSCLHRKCCWCAKTEFAYLIVANHGPYLTNMEGIERIWSKWNPYTTPEYHKQKAYGQIG